MVTLFDSLDIEVVGVMQLLITLFGASHFMLGGIDKLKHWSVREQSLRSLLSTTFLAPYAGFVYQLQMVLEIKAGIAAVYGVVMWLTGINTTSFLAILLCAATTLVKFCGRRLANDDTGAAMQVGYFLVFIFGLYLFYR